ncbi:hypothetical protein Plhal703r1_c24g0100771 [Plasmopara halstedii]
MKDEMVALVDIDSDRELGVLADEAQRWQMASENDSKDCNFKNVR